MLHSRFIMTKTDAIVLSMVFLVNAYVQGITVVLRDSNEMNDQSIGRMKRMSQISCHCCSLSFNSHCCLQCMSRLRIGRRSAATNLNNDHQLTDLSNVIEDNINGIEEKTPSADHPEQTQITMCTCCLHQISGNPYIPWWPCCRECHAL